MLLMKTAEKDCEQQNAKQKTKNNNTRHQDLKVIEVPMHEKQQAIPTQKPCLYFIYVYMK